MINFIEQSAINFANWIWGIPLLMITFGGGLILLVFSRFVQFKHFNHAIQILRGKYDDKADVGKISHYNALSTAIAATVGMGNIAGVAVAIKMGGPGTVFWMWVFAFVGMCVKFFTCSLAVMYRSKINGQVEAGPMYVIVNGLGKKWKPLAILFSVAGMVGALPIFQANQLTQAICDILLVPNQITTGFTTNLIIGLILTIIVIVVIFGGIKSIANTAGRLVPVMIIIYFIAVFTILISQWQDVPYYFKLIFTDALSAEFYTGDRIAGSALAGLIILGARRASFSNEAGIGTAPMIHGLSKTNSPIQEGLVAMLGPFIDTIVVCTLTALTILVTGVWQTSESSGVGLTNVAFKEAIPYGGSYILLLCILIFAITSLFSYSYLGSNCFAFLFGVKRRSYYNYVYVATIIIGATSSLGFILSLIDGAYAVMAIPTMVSTLILAPKVMKKARQYFNNKPN